MSNSSITGALAYMNAVRAMLDDIVNTQTEAIDQAAAAMVSTIKADGMIYLFGTGHSHMLAEEGHYRAGGLAPTCPVFDDDLMLHKSATASSDFERTPGLAAQILARYQPMSKDTLFVFSNSGVNIMPVEMALAGKDAGMTVVAVLSRRYAEQAKLNALGKKLYDVADIVIDNRGVPGDAIAPVGDTELKSSATSTVASAFIFNALVAEVANRLHAEGLPIPIFISSNIPGAAEHNAALLARYRTRNPHL